MCAQAMSSERTTLYFVLKTSCKNIIGLTTDICAQEDELVSVKSFWLFDRKPGEEPSCEPPSRYKYESEYNSSCLAKQHNIAVKRLLHPFLRVFSSWNFNRTQNIPRIPGGSGVTDVALGHDAIYFEHGCEQGPKSKNYFDMCAYKTGEGLNNAQIRFDQESDLANVSSCTCHIYNASITVHAFDVRMRDSVRLTLSGLEGHCKTLDSPLYWWDDGPLCTSPQGMNITLSNLGPGRLPESSWLYITGESFSITCGVTTESRGPNIPSQNGSSFVKAVVYIIGIVIGIILATCLLMGIVKIVLKKRSKPKDTPAEDSLYSLQQMPNGEVEPYYTSRDDGNADRSLPPACIYSQPVRNMAHKPLLTSKTELPQNYFELATGDVNENSTKTDGCDDVYSLGKQESPEIMRSDCVYNHLGESSTTTHSGNIYGHTPDEEYSCFERDESPAVIGNVYGSAANSQ